MKLHELLQFDNIVIQCHNDPDADAIASGLGVLTYLRQRGKTARLIYGGSNEIEKSNLVLMTKLLDIPVEHVTALEEEPDLLLTVDGQYGERNVQKFPCKAFAVIDHHKANTATLPPMREVRDNYGACATIIWDMLREEGVDVEGDERLSSALYYGLFMDTNKMQELRHPKDRDLRAQLEFRCCKSVLLQLQSHNLSLDELRIAGDALSGCDYYQEHNYAVAEVRQCDPNILGIIGDMMIEVDSIDISVIGCRQSGGVKFSVRSSAWETQANQLARFLAAGLGNGGGHLRKSGGFLNEGPLKEAMAGRSLRQFLSARLEEYFQGQDVIYAGSGELPDLSGEPLYEKQRVSIGYVYARDLGCPAGTRLRIRMLEGDKIQPIDEDTVIIVGVEGEVYTNSEAYFLAHNDLSDEPYVFREEYIPGVAEAVQAEVPEDTGGEMRSLKDAVRTCVTRPGSCIRARPLTRRTKILNTAREECMQGDPGDWLAARAEDPGDVYIIKNHIFEKTYRRKDGQ